MDLQGKTALVTGAGRGIGRAIAENLAREGAKVIAVGRTKDEIESTAEAISGLSVLMDVTDRASIAIALDHILGTVQAIDILVNNAGAAESAPLGRTTDELWDRMLAINVTSAFTLTRALIGPMVRRGFGRVVNIASNAGLTGYAYSSAYCASKHALVGFTRALALEVASANVTVNAVCPGWVRTKLSDDAVLRIAEKTGRSQAEARESLENMSPQKRMVEATEVAALVTMLCGEQARSIHGQALVIDGGQVMA